VLRRAPVRTEPPLGAAEVPAGHAVTPQRRGRPALRCCVYSTSSLARPRAPCLLGPPRRMLTLLVPFRSHEAFPRR
jgi:hypothetical protein